MRAFMFYTIDRFLKETSNRIDFIRQAFQLKRRSFYRDYLKIGIVGVLAIWGHLFADEIFEEAISPCHVAESSDSFAMNRGALSDNHADFYPFYSLRLTSDDRYNITKLIKSMGDLNLWELLKKSKQMKKLGKKINPIHPMRFLAFIYSNPSLKKRMPKIRNSYFKWSKFMEGLSERLSLEAKNNNLYQYIPGFCQVIGCRCSDIEEFVLDHDWRGFVDFLMFYPDFD